MAVPPCLAAQLSPRRARAAAQAYRAPGVAVNRCAISARGRRQCARPPGARAACPPPGRLPAAAPWPARAAQPIASARQASRARSVASGGAARRAGRRMSGSGARSRPPRRRRAPRHARRARSAPRHRRHRPRQDAVAIDQVARRSTSVPSSSTRVVGRQQQVVLRRAIGQGAGAHAHEGPGRGSRGELDHRLERRRGAADGSTSMPGVQRLDRHRAGGREHGRAGGQAERWRDVGHAGGGSSVDLAQPRLDAAGLGVTTLRVASARRSTGAGPGFGAEPGAAWSAAGPGELVDAALQAGGVQLLGAADGSMAITGRIAAASPRQQAHLDRWSGAGTDQATSRAGTPAIARARASRRARIAEGTCRRDLACGRSISPMSRPSG